MAARRADIKPKAIKIAKRMIAKKIEELLVKIHAKRVLIVGGTAQNDVVIDYVRESFELVDVPAEAPYYEATRARGDPAPVGTAPAR